MNIFSISDLHLSFGVANKSMDIFGENWIDHFNKIASHWKEVVTPDDLVCIAGDISWALRLEDAKKDLDWIDSLPGTKCMIRGNHDYWFSSVAKVKTILPPSIHVVHNNAFSFQQIAIAGTRLWDSPDFNFDSLFSNTPREKSQELEKIYQRELQRLELSLKQMDPDAKIKIAMTHYPPISLSGEENPATTLLEKYQVKCCLFGHLHGLDPNKKLFNRVRGVDYHLTSCDYLDFKLLKVMSV